MEQTITKYRVHHAPGTSYTEFATRAEAEAFVTSVGEATIEVITEVLPPEGT